MQPLTSHKCWPRITTSPAVKADGQLGQAGVDGVSEGAKGFTLARGSGGGRGGRCVGVEWIRGEGRGGGGTGSLVGRGRVVGGGGERCSIQILVFSRNSCD